MVEFLILSLALIVSIWGELVEDFKKFISSRWVSSSSILKKPEASFANVPLSLSALITPLSALFLITREPLMSLN